MRERSWTRPRGGGEAVTGGIMLAVRVGLAFILALAAVAPVHADATDDLLAAAKGGTASEVSAVLAAGADLNARGERGNTPLHEAARHNPEPSVVAALIKAGADPNVRNEHGDTPLHSAAWRNPEPSVVGALIKAGADVDARAEDGKTPLHAAAENNPEPSVVAALIEAGADPSARDKDGKTPFDYAKKHNEALRGTDVYWRLNEARFK